MKVVYNIYLDKGYKNENTKTYKILDARKRKWNGKKHKPFFQNRPLSVATDGAVKETSGEKQHRKLCDEAIWKL